MKSTSLIIVYIFINLLSFGQDPEKEIAVRDWHFTIKVGGYYKSFIGDKYIPPTVHDPMDFFDGRQYERFTKRNTWGVQAGILVDYTIVKSWYITSGLLLCNRTERYENNLDTVIKYGIDTYMSVIQNVLKYDFIYFNLELPMFVSWKKKDLNLSAGIYIPFLTLNRSNFTYAVNLFYGHKYWTTTRKTFMSLEYRFMIFPTLKVSYDFRSGRTFLCPFMEISLGASQTIYLMGGLQIAINNSKKIR